MAERKEAEWMDRELRPEDGLTEGWIKALREQFKVTCRRDFGRLPLSEVQRWPLLRESIDVLLPPVRPEGK